MDIASLAIKTGASVALGLLVAVVYLASALCGYKGSYVQQERHSSVGAILVDVFSLSLRVALLN